jgi:hypothetical protein
VNDQRRTKRFDLDLAVEIVRSGSERFSHPGRTRNISSGGVLLSTSARMEIGGPVEYIVTLQTTEGGAVGLRCMGKVLRLEPEAVYEGEQTFAVTLERYEFLRVNGHKA